jgi:hypothetical protein
LRGKEIELGNLGERKRFTRFGGTGRPESGGGWPGRRGSSASAEAGGSKVVEALRGVGGREAIHASHFDDELVPDRVAFVGDR